MIFQLPSIFEYLTESKDDMIKLYHYDKLDGLTELDPAKTTPNSYTRDDYNAFGVKRVFYYTDPSQKEIMISGHLYVVYADKSKIYDIDKDELGYYDESAKEKTFLNETMYGVSGSKFNKNVYEIKFIKNDDSQNIIKYIKTHKKTLNIDDVKDVIDNNSNIVCIVTDDKVKSDSDKTISKLNKILSLYPNSQIEIKQTEFSNRITQLVKTYDILYDKVISKGYIGFIYEHVPGKVSNKTVVLWEKMPCEQIS